MSDTEVFKWLSVEEDALEDFFTFRRAGSRYREGFPTFWRYRHAVKEGCAEVVAVGSRTDRVEAHGGEDEPCRHLPGIVVAGESARGVEIFRVRI